MPQIETLTMESSLYLKFIQGNIYTYSHVYQNDYVTIAQGRIWLRCQNVMALALLHDEITFLCPWIQLSFYSSMH